MLKISPHDTRRWVHALVLILQGNDLSRSIQDGPAVLHGLSFSISAGERIGVVGRTGSGKVKIFLPRRLTSGANDRVEFPYSLSSEVNLDRGQYLFRWPSNQPNQSGCLAVEHHYHSADGESSNPTLHNVHRLTGVPLS